jgi:phosphatidylglycerophosphatase A
MSALARLLGTWFYCGYVPKGPGTAGSAGALLVGVPVAVYLQLPPFLFAVAALLSLAPGIWAAGVMAREGGRKDPQTVVIDEVIGQWIALAGAPALNGKYVLAAFLLFRAFDIWKPPPARALEGIPGGTGIVLDDVVAGIYAALVLAAAGWFNR